MPLLDRLRHIGLADLEIGLGLYLNTKFACGLGKRVCFFGLRASPVVSKKKKKKTAKAIFLAPKSYFLRFS